MLLGREGGGDLCLQILVKVTCIMAWLSRLKIPLLKTKQINKQTCLV